MNKTNLAGLGERGQVLTMKLIINHITLNRNG
jgi:hypothetical protein